jgi:hypothetical protein
MRFKLVPANTGQVLAYLLLLAFSSYALPDDALPPEVQADILRTKIINAVRNVDKTHDYRPILDAIAEYKKLAVPMPPILELVEAKAAKNTGDSRHSFDALKSVLAHAPRDSAPYKEALSLYPSYEASAEAANSIVQQNEEAEKERQQYDTAVSKHTSYAYQRYLDLYSTSTHAAEIRQRLASCHTVSTLKPVSYHEVVADVADGHDDAEACEKAMQKVSSKAYSVCQKSGAVETNREEVNPEPTTAGPQMFFKKRVCSKEYRITCTTKRLENHKECN